MRALGADTKHGSDQDVETASLSIIAVRPDGSIRLAIFSDVGHIPVEKKSWSGRGGGWVKEVVSRSSRRRSHSASGHRAAPENAFHSRRPLK